MGLRINFRPESWSDWFCRITEGNHHGWKIVKNRAACADNRTVAYPYTRRNEDIRRNPDLIFDADGLVIDIEAGALHIMARGAQVGALRNHDI